MVEQEKASKELKALQKEHKELDAKIRSISAAAIFDQISLQRLKRRKLWLKDRMSLLESWLYDDIIA